MKFKIPFTFSSYESLKKQSIIFSIRIRHKKNSHLEEYLKNSGVKLEREEYIGICIRSFIINFILSFLISTTILFLLSVDNFLVIGFLCSILIIMFTLFSQTIYPKIFVSRRQKNIEKNLLSALEDISVQLSSGIPLFSILANISEADYGELSKEFKKAVIRINAGEPESDVLDDIGRKNPSLLFRRTLWQISNSMRAGSDIILVVRDNIKALNEEQMLQIQNYGNKLNPLMVFYMLVSVIIPALSVSFLTIIASLINLPENMIVIIYIGLFVLIALIQVIFLGMIKSRRPSLL